MPVLMPNPVFRWFVPAQNGTGLVPAAGYIAAFYQAGTDIAKTIYMPDGTPYPSPANEAELNSEGYAEIWLGAGSYKLRVLDPDRAEVYTLDNINGDGSFGTGFVETVQPTATPPAFGPNGLAAVDTSSNKFTWCAGYYAIGDGGHGFFWNETTEVPDDGGYVIASTFDPTKAWFRVPDEDGAVRASAFGYIGTKTGNLTNQLLSACAYAISNGKKLLIGSGSNAVVGDGTATLYLYADEFHLEPGSMFTGDGILTTIVFNGVVTGSVEQHFTDCTYRLGIPQEDDHPEWVGGDRFDPDNSAAFTKWFASQAGAYTLPPGVWYWTGNGASFPYPTVPFTMLGSIHPSVGTDIPTGYYGQAASRIRANQFALVGGATITSSGANAAVVGDINVTGGVYTTESIATDSSINADGDISAGVGGLGRLTGRAGNGTSRYTAGGLIGSSVTTATTSGTSLTVLSTLPIYANTLITPGDMLRISVNAVFSGSSAQLKYFYLKLGSAAITSATAPQTVEDGTVHIDCELTLTSTGNCRGTSRTFWSHNSGDLFDVDFQNQAIDFTVDQSLTVNAQAAVNGDITFQSISIQFLPLY